MQAYWTLARRELAGFFLSLTGYVIMAGAAFLVGISLWSLVKNLQGEPTTAPITEMFCYSYLFWFIVLLGTTVITMRLFALEKFSGTFETLMTTPVNEAQVVAAKFTAAMVFYLVSWLPLLGCVFILRHYASNASGFDAGVIGSTFLGIFLLGGVFISMGCFASSLTQTQMVAAMISLVLNIGLFVVSFLSDKLPSADWKSQTLALFALPDQMHDFARGIVDTRPVVFYLSLTFFFLFLTLRVVESRRWK
jgi:ABC-2 type transport system permease protein